MGNSFCARRDEEQATDAELREKRLRRFAEVAQPGPVQNNQQRNEGKPAPAVPAPEPAAAAAAAAAAVATPASPQRATKAAVSSTSPEAPPKKIAKAESADTIASKAARLVGPLARNADYETIELLLRVINDILKHPSSTRNSPISLNRLQFQLRPEVRMQEMFHIRSVLTGIGFMEEDADSADSLELPHGADLALARELVQKIEKTRSLWKPAHVERQAREDAAQAEVMSTTGCTRQHALDALAAAGGSDTVFAIGLISDGPKDEQGKPMRSPHYIMNITSQSEESVRHVWGNPHEPLAEYKAAAHAICLSPRWVAQTRLGRILSSVDAELMEDPARLSQMKERSHFEDVLFKLIMKAYNSSDAMKVRNQMSLPCGFEDKSCNIVETVCDFCFLSPAKLLGGGSPPPLKYMSWCAQTLLMLEEPSIIEVKLFEICDVAPRCGSARKQTFNSLVTHCFALRDASRAETSPTGTLQATEKTPREVALARFEEFFEDFLDDHKAQAFTSAFIAPGRYYLHHTGHEGGSFNMMIHGTNWYLTLVHATLGMPLPLSGHYDDHLIRDSSLVDFWQGLSEEAWTFFSDMKNFGKYSADLPRLPEGVTFVREKDEVDKLKLGELPAGHFPGAKAMCLGNSAANPGHEQKSLREKLAIYLERFAHFFQSDLFVRKAFETLNSESKSEHVGFSSVAQALYTHYREEVLKGLGEDTLLEHVYQDEYFMQLDVTRVAKFFSWLGFIKDSA